MISEACLLTNILSCINGRLWHYHYFTAPKEIYDLGKEIVAVVLNKYIASSGPLMMTFFFSVADGVALGAAVTTSKTEVEVIVFVAIMLHKVWVFFFLVILPGVKLNLCVLLGKECFAYYEK